MYLFLHVSASDSFKLISISCNTPIEKLFSHGSNQFLNSLILMLLLFFVSPLPHWQSVSLWGLFSSKETKKMSFRERSVNRECGYGAHAIFGQKLPNTGVVWASVLINHSSWHGQTHWKSLQKNSLKPNTASYNNASWCTDTDVFLEHSPSGGKAVLQGAHPPECNFFHGPPFTFIKMNDLNLNWHIIIKVHWSHYYSHLVLYIVWV